VRPVWRLVFWFFCFVFLAIVGTMAIGPIPGSTSLQWGGTVVSVVAAIGAGWISLMRLDNRPAAALGLSRRGIAGQLFAGFLIGGALILATAILLFATGSLSFSVDSGSAPGLAWFFLWTLLFFAISALFEEAIFRGYPFQVLVEWLGSWPAIAITAGIFALMHGRNPGVTALAGVNIFLAGVLLSVAYLRTMSLWFATGVHLGWNWIMVGPLDLPVSGFVADAPLYSGDSSGSALWTGGDFGPEAGLAATLVLIVGITWLLRTRRLRPAAGALAPAPLAEARAREAGLL
jgi:membrane protease YdiL (CAAX protease family)